MLTSKIRTEIIENHSEFSGCQNSCNKFVTSRSWYTMKLPMILLWKQWCWRWGAGVASAPPKFWFAENLGKSPENPDKIGAQRRLTSNDGAQGLHKNTWKPFSGGYQKRGVHDLVEVNLLAKVSQKTFRASVRKFGQNSSHPKNLPTPAPMMKRHLRPRCPSFERTEGEMLPSLWLHSPASLCLLFYTHSLYSLL